MIQQEIRSFFAALTFFTRIPSPLPSQEFDQTLVNRPGRYFSLVGWVTGGISALVLVVTGPYLPESVSVILSIIAGILVTGAFHENGFANVCDGFGRGRNKERILEIMKDIRIGSFGTIGLILILLSKYLLLMELPFHYLPLVLIAAHSISRTASTYCIYTHTYVENDAASKAKPLGSGLTRNDMMINATLGILPILFLDSWWYLTAIIPVLITKWWMGGYFKKWIGGYTGSCLGAIQQVAEVVFYLSVIFLKQNIV